MLEVHADPERDPCNAAIRRQSRFCQDARTFGALAEKVIRPFQAYPALRQGGCCFCQGKTRQQAPLRCLSAGAAGSQQDRKIEVTRWRIPMPATTTMPRRLLCGEDHQACRFASNSAFDQGCLGARQAWIVLQAPIDTHPPSNAIAADCAAATKGAGQSAKAKVKIPAAAITTPRLAGASSKRPAASSKYMIFTMRR